MGASGSKLDKKWHLIRRAQQTIAKQLYPEIFEKYAEISQKSTHGSKFYAGWWVKAGGTQEQITTIKAKAQSGAAGEGVAMGTTGWKKGEVKTRWQKGGSSYEASQRSAKIQIIFRKSVLDANPDYPKDGMSPLTKLQNENPKEYDKLFQKARSQYFTGALSEVTGETEEDIRIKREAILLQFKGDVEREQKAGTKKITFRHNNEQVALSASLLSRGISCDTEKNYADLIVNQTALGELKIEPTKQDYATGIGELMIGEIATGLTTKFILSVDRKTPTSVLKVLDALKITALSKKGDVIVADNEIEGHERLRQIMVTA